MAETNPVQLFRGDWHNRSTRRTSAEPSAPPSPLQMLAIRFTEDLPPEGAELAVSLHRLHLTLAYHQIVFLKWRAEGSDLICTPIGWHDTTYAARDPGEAYSLTIRLVFEFLKPFQTPHPGC